MTNDKWMNSIDLIFDPSQFHYIRGIYEFFIQNTKKIERSETIISHYSLVICHSLVLQSAGDVQKPVDDEINADC